MIPRKPPPALSRRHEAPVLLTEPDDLPNAIRRFIERRGISEVMILGGTDVVSAEVEQEVDDLAGNANLRTIKAVVGDSTPPRVSRIAVTAAVASQRAMVSFDGEDGTSQRVSGALQVSTKQDSSVDGAAGNT